MTNIIKLADVRMERETPEPNTQIVEKLELLLHEAQAGRVQEILVSAILIPAPDDPDNDGSSIPSVAFFEAQDATSLEVSLMHSNTQLLLHKMAWQMLDMDD